MKIKDRKWAKGGGDGPLVIAGFNITALTQAPLRLVKSVWLKAAPEKVFTAISNPEELTRLLPWVHKVTVDTSQASIAGGVGTRRFCHFGNGLVLEEVVVGWQPPQLYAYLGVEAQHPFGMKGHLAVIICETGEKQGATLTWRHYFEHANPTAMQEKMDDSMRVVIQNLVNRFGGRRLSRT